ncbi:MAG: isopeptide-forming domain-containing fimbrial protein, partial [Eubacterium sp.]|nr:isopeptide-forming domain-containing fimbrial protein [Eubacterium sp.]
MKHMKKMMALALAMVMVLAMSMTVFAAEGDYKITVTNTNDSVSIDGQTYSAYKLFDLKYNIDKTAYSYTIKTDNYFYSTAGAKAVLDKYFTFTASAGDSTVMVVEPKTTGTYYDSTTKTISDAGARQLADDLQQYLASATPVKTGTASGETAEITVGEDGYFIVTGSATPKDPKASETVVSAVILTNAQPTATVAPKVSIPTLDKKITGVTEDGSKLDDDGKAAVAKVGAKVSYELDSITPDLRGYTDYTFIISDEISTGLTYDNTSLSSLVVKIGGTVVPATATVEDETVNNYTLAVNGQKFTLTIPFDTLKKYEAGTAIVVTYDAIVNSNALNTDYENNTANLTYSHSPYDNTTNKTPDKETYVIDLNIDVDKVAENATGSKLSGATFKLYKTVAGATTYAAAEAYDANATYYSDAEGTTPVEIADEAAFTAYDGT